MYRTDFWTLWEKVRVGCFKRTASKHIYYLGWNRSPTQVGCMRQVLGPGALGRPRGIGWRGRWEGGSGWGIHVNLWLIHVNVWQKPLQYCKVFSLQLIKINETKKRKVKVKTLSRVWLLVTPWTAAYQAPPSMGFSRQEYSNGVPLPSPMPTVQMTVIEKLQQLLQFDYGTTDRDSLKDFSGACVQQMK